MEAGSESLDDPSPWFERPLLPETWEQLVLRGVSSLKRGMSPGGVRCDDVRLVGSFPTTQIEVVLVSTDTAARGAWRFELYRPLFLRAPDGRLRQAAEAAEGITQFCNENAGGIIAGRDKTHTSLCHLLVVYAIDRELRNRPDLHVSRIDWDERRVLIIGRRDGVAFEMGIDCVTDQGRVPSADVATAALDAVFS